MVFVIGLYELVVVVVVVNGLNVPFPITPDPEILFAVLVVVTAPRGALAAAMPSELKAPTV